MNSSSSSAPALTAAQRAGLLMGEARELWQAGDIGRASEVMLEACTLSRTTSDNKLKAEAHMRIGIIYNFAYKYDLAFRAINLAEEFTKGGDVPAAFMLKLEANRAAFLLGAGFLRKSLDSLLEVGKKSASALDGDGRVAFIDSHINLIYNYILLGKKKAAIDIGAKISPLARDPSSPIDPLNRVAYYSWHATALAQAGDTKGAIELLTEARKIIPAGNKAMEINFSIALGVSEVHSGLVDQGISRLTETLRHAENYSLFFQNALYALTLVYEHVGNIAKALELIERLENVMKEAARGVVGIQGDEDAYDTPAELVEKAEATAKSIAEAIDAAIDAREKGLGSTAAPHPIETNVDTTSVRRLDDRAARLRMKRFNELTHDERGELFDQLAKAAALVDDETGKHCARVELLTYKFAIALKWEEPRARLLAQAARLHDVGKLGIPHRILLAPRKLTPMEYEIVKKHVNIGVDLLGFSQAEVVKLARTIAQGHHEKWDGSGYPKKLLGDQNPIEARIVSIVDVFDVITHQRSYKRAWNVQFAREELEFNADKQFDPDLVEIFLRDVVQADYVIPTDFPNEIPTMFEVSEFDVVR
jgi:HD-GYP domain-containing protein (c-di-GMP phosphodiesterase class II)